MLERFNLSHRLNLCYIKPATDGVDPMKKD